MRIEDTIKKLLTETKEENTEELFLEDFNSVMGHVGGGMIKTAGVASLILVAAEAIKQLHMAQRHAQAAYKLHKANRNKPARGHDLKAGLHLAGAVVSLGTVAHFLKK